MTGSISHLLGAQGEEHLQILEFWSSPSLAGTEQGGQGEDVPQSCPCLQDCVAEISPSKFQPLKSLLS